MTDDKSVLSDITIYTKYAKFLPELNRRETWEELTTRNMQMHIKKYPQLEDSIKQTYQDHVIPKKVLPSMRSLQFGGKGIELNNSRVYNCAFLPIDSIHSFSETMFLLLGGTGVGFSVQNFNIEKLPEIQKPNYSRRKKYVVQDSIIGWADAVKVLMKSYVGKIRSHIDFDLSDIREKGALLVTTGGKAPGPAPLKLCLENIERVLRSKKDGERLTDIECYDIECYIADAVLAGGIRRAAMIALFDLGSKPMISAKSKFKVLTWDRATVKTGVDNQGEPIMGHAWHESKGKRYLDLLVKVKDNAGKIYEKTCYWVSEEDFEYLQTHGTLPWYYFEPQRGRANNSISLVRHKITKSTFMKVWKQIEESGAGEPGIYLTNDKEWGTNPCCEIALRPYQFCNLTEINMSNIKDQEDFEQRAAAAAFIGTLQAGYIDFHYLRDVWEKNTKKDALIGVSMTGIASESNLKLDFTSAVEVVKRVNKEISSIIGINSAARTTCVKPAGTTSLVLGTSSGIHAWFWNYYLRRLRINKDEAIYKYLLETIPQLIEDEYFTPELTAVLTVPQKAPEGAILRTETPLELLERVKLISNSWIKPGHRRGNNTHNVSCTVSIKDGEWEEVGEWMWKNKEYYNGLSVLPYDGGNYKQTPFENCTQEEYDYLLQFLKEIDLSLVNENEDQTSFKESLACAGGSCEI